ncbi:MAG TPA: hypothetical protein VJB59_14655 [Bdellovibrionota bacterium]|nr:hypothetical protein [Bdellovibrionota bacterium]
MTTLYQHSEFSEITRFLEARCMMPTRPPALDSTRRALKRAGLLERIVPAKNIIIAGTNGKGSVSATLSRLLHSAGIRAGLYTSPHLVSTTERIRVAEQDISQETFVSAYHAVSKLIESEELTHFEALTLIATWIFYSGEASPPIDFAIWEVGLGGRLDATNAIPHQFCAITRLGLDHQNLLGNSLSEIAAEKFGVIPARGHVIYSPLDPSLEPLRAQTEKLTNSEWKPAVPVDILSLDEIMTPWGRAKLTLPGLRGAENTATALSIFAELGFDPSPHLPSLASVRWPGRFQEISIPGCPCPVHLSGDHNPQGITSLIEILRQLSWNQLHLILGIAHDKDSDSMFEKILELPRVKLYLTETPYKTRKLVTYSGKWLNLSSDKDPDVHALLRRVSQQATPGDRIVISGSLYLVGKVLAATSNFS